MNETLVTMVGNVASTVSYGQTAAGVPMANFRMAATERRYDRSRGDWVDGDTNWVSVVAWRWLATNVVSSLNKGDPVVVSGRLRVREWEEGGGRRSAVQIEARVVGHDLGRGTAAFRWAVQGRPELVAAQSGPRAVEAGGAVMGAPVGMAGPVMEKGRKGEAMRSGGRFGDEASAGGAVNSVGEAVPEWIVKAVRAREAALAASAAGAAVGPAGPVGDASEGPPEAGGAGVEAVRGDGGSPAAPAAKSARRRRRPSPDPADGEPSQTPSQPPSQPPPRPVAGPVKEAQGGAASAAMAEQGAVVPV